MIGLKERPEFDFNQTYSVDKLHIVYLVIGENNRFVGKELVNQIKQFFALVLGVVGLLIGIGVDEGLG